MGNEIKISIIVAAYNVEQYIDRCLDSLTIQDIPSYEYEIIIVNDGSTDSTLAILNKWKTNFDNIIVINQSNKGQSAARNLALTQAKGDYVFYVDADDYIEKNCLGLLLNGCKGVDILRFGYFDAEVETFDGEYKKIYRGISVFEHCYGIWSPWMQIFRKEFLLFNKLFFIEGMTSEDAELIPRAYLLANSVTVIPEKIYHYVYNPVSTTKQRSYNFDRIYKRIESQHKVLGYCADLMVKYNGNKLVVDKLHDTVVYPTFTAFCVMILLEEIPFKVSKNFQNAYHKSKFYPVIIHQKQTHKQRLMYKIMNSRLLFNLYYFSGLKKTYIRLYK